MSQSRTQSSNSATAQSEGSDWMSEKVRRAVERGEVESGGYEIADSDEDIESLEAEAIVTARSTIPVTLRMSPETVDALKEEAKLLGVRGYQTLMKQWIDERLNGSDQRSNLIQAYGHLEQAVRQIGQAAGVRRRVSR